MKTIEILKELDRIACAANQVWNQCESLKMRIANDEDISHVKMKEHGIHVPETEDKT